MIFCVVAGNFKISAKSLMAKDGTIIDLAVCTFKV